MADGSITIDTKIDASQLDSIVDQVSSKLGQIEKNTGSAFAKMRDFMQGPVAALHMVKDALLAVGGATVMQAAAIEDLEAAFTPMVGGAENAKAMIAALNKEAATTPYELEGIANVAKQLLPVLGNDVKAVTETFRMLGDTAGGNIQKLDSITRGYMKTMLKGKVDMESLNMIAEAGVPIYKSLADSMGVTTAEMMDMSSKGKITSDDLTKAFKGMTSEGGIFFDGMNIASQTLAGKMSTLNDNVKQAGAAIGNELLPATKELIDEVNKIVESFVEWATTGDNVKNMLDTIGTVLITAGAAMVAYAVATGAVSTAILSTLIPALAAAAGGVKAFTAAIAANPIGLVAVLITAVLVPAIIHLIKNWDTAQFRILQGFELIKIGLLYAAKGIMFGAEIMFAPFIFGINKIIEAFNKLTGKNIPTVTDAFKSMNSAIDAQIAKSQGNLAALGQKHAAAVAKHAAQNKTSTASMNADADARAANEKKNTSAVITEHEKEKASANRAAAASTKRTEKKKEEQKEELVGIEKISKAYEDMVAKMDSSNASFLGGLKSMNDMLSTSIGGMSETLDLLSFAGPIGQASQFYDKIIELGGAIESIITVGPEKAAEMMDTLLEAVIGIIDNLPALGVAVVKIIQTVFIKLVEALPDILTGLFESSMTLGPALSIAIIKAIPDMVKALALFPVELVKSIPDMINSMGSAFYQMGIEIVKMIGAGIVAVGNLIQWIGEILPNPADIEPFNIGDIGAAIVNAIAAGINFAGALFEKVRGFFSAFFEALKNFFINIPSIGAAIVDGIVNGILSAPAIFGRVVQFFQDFLDSIKRFFLISSPSQVFAGIGGNLIAGIVEGILSAPDLFESTKDVFTSFMGKVADVFAAAFDIGAGLWDSIKSGIESVKDAGGGAVDTVRDWFGFSTGGYTGDGPRDEVAGVVHKGEYVIPADETQALGLDSKSASLQSIMNGIASGGVQVAAPSGAGAGMSITLNNVLTTVLQADGMTLAKIMMRHIDSVGGQYFGSQS